MANRLVDVFDDSGGKLFTYTIALESECCLDADFEEVALVFAESSGLVDPAELPLLRARCADVIDPTSAAAPVVPMKAKRVRGRVISLVKRRMAMASSRTKTRANKAS